MNFQVTELEAASIYRESHAYGNVSKEGVSIETFFTAASETGFFIKHLKFDAQIKFPKLDTSGNLSYG
jgi:hypothetical protein